MAEGALKVGELARRTGLTVRTLHHYDEIGLLSPAERTPSGHRLYGIAEVKRLQQISSLRHLGLSLEEIGACLEGREFTLARTLTMHVQRVREDIRRQERLGNLLEALLHQVETSGDVSVDGLIETIELTAVLEEHYSEEQLAALAARRKDVGEDRMHRAGDEWQEIFAGYRKCMEAGLPPTADEVLDLARRGAALVEEFTGGDAGIRNSLQTMVRAEGDADFMGRMGMDVDAELWTYMGAAGAALEGGTAG